MSEISRTSLFGKLNLVARKSLEAATTSCKVRGNPYVELVHWLEQILLLPDSDLHRIVSTYGLDPARLAKDVTDQLEALPRGATSITDLSGHIGDTVERAWVYGSLMYSASAVRTGHLVIGMMKSPNLKHLLPAISPEFSKIELDELTDRLDELTVGCPEQPDPGATAGVPPAPGAGAMHAPALGGQEALETYTVDLTEEARQGRIDPIVGRDDEIRQIVDILLRRKQNNPLLTGEAGVGKTAVVEGFALRVANGDVPPSMKDVTIRTLDIGLLQAGASMKGEFEDRLRQVIDEVQASEKPIILFVDEAHTLIGAGGAAGTGDAANLLKPALARGTLRTIGATTWAEYKRHIEPDPALTRRFQVILVDEPSEEKAVLMMRGVAATLEKHHMVHILDEALLSSVQLSHRYIPARQLPDKSVSLLDTACARVAVSQHAVPAELDDSNKRIEALETELAILSRESSIGLAHGERTEQVLGDLSAERDRAGELQRRWKDELETIERILELRQRLSSHDGNSTLQSAQAGTTPPSTPPELNSSDTPGAEPVQSPSEGRESDLEQLHELQARLADLQGDAPLVLSSVDAIAVGSVVADWTGIPVGRMVRDDVATVLNLSDELEKRIIGQRHALDAIAKRLRTSRAGLDNPNRPVGVFMLAGTSGVGKTETALALAETLYGGEHNVVTINMSEYQEPHTVSSLKGAPPGYVGYGEGGVLTEAVRRTPYSVVLLDEVEKAHSDVHEIFFQVFDKGRMEDGVGRSIDFSNTVIILTTNIGTDVITQACEDPDSSPDVELLNKMLRRPLLKVFPPALLGRLTVVPYYPLNDEMLRAITRLQLGRIRERVERNHQVPFTYDDTVLDLIVARCTERESGGRMVDAILTNSILPTVSSAFLTQILEEQPIARVHIAVENSEFAYSFG